MAAISDGIKIHNEVLLGNGFVRVKTWRVSYGFYILRENSKFIRLSNTVGKYSLIQLESID